MAITVLAKLVAKDSDTLGYTTYVFECIDKEDVQRLDTKYIMCVRFPNWDHRKIEITEEGFLNFEELRAGIDKWWDGEKMIPYNYNNIQFLKFVPKKEKPQNEFKMLITFKLFYNMKNT